jgi:hypothetical protein
MKLYCGLNPGAWFEVDVAGVVRAPPEYFQYLGLRPEA